MESISYEGLEKPEKVVLKVFLQRHGPKASATGEKNEVASNFEDSVKDGFNDMNITHGESLVHVVSSNVLRAINTAQIDLNEVKKSGHESPDSIKIKESLATPFQPHGEALEERYADDLVVLVDMQRELEPVVRANIASEHPDFSKEEQEIEARNLIDIEVLKVLFNKDLAQTRGIQTTYEELADRMALRYKGFLKHINLLDKMQNSQKPKEEIAEDKKENSYIEIDVSHSFPIMCLLKKYLVFEDGALAMDMDPDEFFQRVGGVIKESNSIELDYVLVNNAKMIRVNGELSPGRAFNGHLNID